MVSPASLLVLEKVVVEIPVDNRLVHSLHKPTIPWYCSRLVPFVWIHGSGSVGSQSSPYQEIQVLAQPAQRIYLAQGLHLVSQLVQA